MLRDRFLQMRSSHKGVTNFSYLGILRSLVKSYAKAPVTFSLFLSATLFLYLYEIIFKFLGRCKVARKYEYDFRTNVCPLWAATQVIPLLSRRFVSTDIKWSPDLHHQTTRGLEEKCLVQFSAWLNCRSRKTGLRYISYP